jgi:heterodisulfide reductase subunit B
MTYTYYPGCSAHSTSRAYEESIQAVAPLIGLTLRELDDWNCCGATAYMNVNEVLSFCLTARNLALAEKQGDPVCTACSACYTNLAKTNKYLHQFPDLKKKVDTALAEGNLSYKGNLETRHLLDVVVNDIGVEKIKSAVKKPLAGLRVAPYYGCQIVRPVTGEADPEHPVLLEKLISAVGATPVEFALATWCCGGSMMGTNEDVALRLCRNLLLCAERSQADVIAVTCPLCHINLEAYQGRINARYGTKFNIPVLYFTQVMGLAFDLAPKALGLQRAIVPYRQKAMRAADKASAVAAEQGA